MVDKLRIMILMKVVTGSKCRVILRVRLIFKVFTNGFLIVHFERVFYALEKQHL